MYSQKAIASRPSRRRGLELHIKQPPWFFLSGRVGRGQYKSGGVRSGQPVAEAEVTPITGCPDHRVLRSPPSTERWPSHRGPSAPPGVSLVSGDHQHQSITNHRSLITISYDVIHRERKLSGHNCPRISSTSTPHHRPRHLAAPPRATTSSPTQTLVRPAHATRRTQSTVAPVLSPPRRRCRRLEPIAVTGLDYSRRDVTSRSVAVSRERRRFHDAAPAADRTPADARLGGAWGTDVARGKGSLCPW